ncbi:MAG: PAS domain S-box protein [Spirochaetia bacterium]
MNEHPDLIVSYLPDTTLTYVNDAYCDYFGVACKEIIGTSFLRFLPETEHASIREYLNSFTPELSIRRYTHRVLNRRNETHYQEWVDQAFFDEEGGITFHVKLPVEGTAEEECGRE